MTNTERTQQLARLHARLARLGWAIQHAQTWHEAWILEAEWRTTDAERLRLLEESETEVQV